MKCWNKPGWSYFPCFCGCWMTATYVRVYIHTVYIVISPLERNLNDLKIWSPNWVNSVSFPNPPSLWITNGPRGRNRWLFQWKRPWNGIPWASQLGSIPIKLPCYMTNIYEDYPHRFWKSPWNLLKAVSIVAPQLQKIKVWWNERKRDASGLGGYGLIEWFFVVEQLKFLRLFNLWQFSFAACSFCVVQYVIFT